MNLALIGNCAFQALIDQRANVRWLCWPRFDDSFVFGSLLDANAGAFSVHPDDENTSTEQSYLRHSNVLRTEFCSDSGRFEVLDFAPRFLHDETSFKPKMLVRRLRPISGRPWVKVRCDPVYDYGAAHPEMHRSPSHIEWHMAETRMRLTTNADIKDVSESRAFALDRDIYLVLSWGEAIPSPLIDTCENYLRRTLGYWRRWVRQSNIPERFQEEVIRSALVLKLHQYEDSGAITAATTTSIPEAPGSGRNWDYRFCWPRDACFTLGALRRLGHVGETVRFIAFLRDIGVASGATVQPLYGIGGETRIEERVIDHLSGYQGSGPVRIGNAAYAQQQHDVYGELLSAICPLFSDVRFFQSCEMSLVEALIAHIDTTMEQPDCGLWEKRQEPQVYTFSLLMHWAGALAAARAAKSRGETSLSDRASRLAAKARDIIESQCWRPSLGFFAEATQGEQVDASLLMMINLGYLDGSDPRARTHVDAIADALRVGDHLMHRYLHDDGLGETHATFTLCSFWYAEALARLGRQDEAEHVFEALLTHCNHVGLLSEDIDPSSGALWGNFPQTYSHVGLINAAFALGPQAAVIL